jgi:hypothetical protein
VLAKAGAWLDRAAFKPASLPDDLVTVVALTPCVAAGLVIFRLPALRMLAIALAIGTLGLIASYVVLRNQVPRRAFSSLIAAVFGVALIGAGASLVITIEIALLAVVLELLRARYMPAIRAQAGLIAFAAVALATRGAPFTYINPSGKTFGDAIDPIDTWFRFFHQSAWTLDPIRLYVGDVSGPVFATSLLAVAVGVAWLAYARRVSLAVLLAFLVGALAAVYTLRWDVLFQLDSGPTWFVAGLLLADRRLLPDSWSIRPTLGFAAGLFAIGLRHEGYGVQAAYFIVAAIQATMAVLAIVIWAASVLSERLKRTRRLRQREANLRVVKTISRAS